MEIDLAVGLLILAALLFLATIDMAFAQLSDLSLRRLSTESDDSKRPAAAEFLREILDNRSRFRFALSSAIQVLMISFSVLVTIAAIRYLESRKMVVIASLAISLAATVFFRQIVPRLITRNKPENILLWMLPMAKPLYRVASAILSPFSSSARGGKEQQRLDTSATPDAGDDSDNTDDIQALMEVGEAEGIIEEEDRELIESMLEFSETRAGEIMTPRTEIVALPVGSTVRSARDLIIEEKYSRLPVYRDSIDNIEGLIYVRDLLTAWANGKEDDSIQNFLRPVVFVPETKTASELLKSMQVNRSQMAIVIDEYGGVAGIVTIEDIVEEIVGEIEDEDISEDEIIEIVEGEDGYFDVLGATEIYKLERLLDIELDDEEYNTVAGMIISESGRVPKKGEKLSIRGIDVEILRADQKRIHLVRLKPADTEAAATDAVHDT
ncbi:MAG: HlyC/CorC family transporter [Acidobacteria bacterium]|nr:HlyC/CorC family transporter [Acidobacteriota bacterium]